MTATATPSPAPTAEPLAPATPDTVRALASILRPDATAALLAPVSADFIGTDLEVVGARAIGRVLADPMIAKGYRTAYDYARQTYVVYRPGDADGLLTRVKEPELAVRVKAAALVILEELAATEPSPGQRRARETVTALREGGRGVASWVRLAAESVRDLLPVLSDEEADAAEARDKARAADARKANRSGEDPEEAKRQRHAYDARVREGTTGELVNVLDRWLPAFTVDRVRLDELWQDWTAQVRRSERFRVKYPRAARVGRNAFYAAVRDRFDVRPAGQRREVVVIRESEDVAAA